ncbi:hypothetical protein RJT34_31145 [Clitoria ternatea]|uniref:Uncharacterized protein n=1 Tax=Clitoria ternatea TaxID=43366 RepID=A0AAN9F1J8_CLITE
MREILKLDAAVRANYVEEIKLNRYDLATVMLYDACFLLELLISKSMNWDEEITTLFGSNKDDKLRKLPRVGIDEVGKREDILTDLTLLENQIPLLILHTVFQTLFMNLCSQKCVDAREIGAKLIKIGALFLFGYSPSWIFYNFTSRYFEKAAHILELAHVSFVQNVVPKLDFSIETDKGKEVEQTCIQLNRCATKLLAAGVKIKLNTHRFREIDLSRVVGSFQFGVEIEFRDGELEIPPLHITRRTETDWRNFIAWEHHINNRNIHYSITVPKEEMNSIISCDISRDQRCMFTLLAVFLNDLICCASDVHLLRDKGVIVIENGLSTRNRRFGKKKGKGMSNREVEAFFRSMANGIDRGIICDNYHRKMFGDLNEYSATNCALRLPVTFLHSFTRSLEGVYSVQKFLRRGYNLAAVIVTLRSSPSSKLFIQFSATIIPSERVYADLSG